MSKTLPEAGARVGQGAAVALKGAAASESIGNPMKEALSSVEKVSLGMLFCFCAFCLLTLRGVRVRWYAFACFSLMHLFATSVYSRSRLTLCGPITDADV